MLRRLTFSPRPHSLPVTLPCAKLQLKRHLFSSTHKSAYVRFGGSSQPRRSQTNLYDFRTWDSRIQIAALLTAGGTIYYISQYALFWFKLYEDQLSICFFIIYCQKPWTSTRDRTMEIHEHVSRIRSSSTHRIIMAIVHSIISTMMLVRRTAAETDGARAQTCHASPWSSSLSTRPPSRDTNPSCFKSRLHSRWTKAEPTFAIRMECRSRRKLLESGHWCWSSKKSRGCVRTNEGMGSHSGERHEDDQCYGKSRQVRRLALVVAQHYLEINSRPHRRFHWYPSCLSRWRGSCCCIRTWYFFHKSLTSTWQANNSCWRDRSCWYVAKANCSHLHPFQCYISSCTPYSWKDVIFYRFVGSRCGTPFAWGWFRTFETCLPVSSRAP